MTTRVRRVFVTINNCTDGDLDGLEILERECKFLFAAREIGKETGTAHLHVYIEFERKVQFAYLKRHMLRGNIQACKGTKKQNIAYLQKEEVDPYIKGDMVGGGQGERSDILLCTDMVKAGGNALYSIAKAYPVQFVYYHRGLRALQAELVAHRHSAPEVVVWWGPTGTGKSHSAREAMGEHDYYVWGPDMGKWWDGYYGQQYVIMEEFRGQLPLGTILRLLDKWDCRVETKGGSIPFVATHIHITSPKPWYDWYSDQGPYDLSAQLKRRITKEMYMDTPYVHVASVQCQEVVGNTSATTSDREEEPTRDDPVWWGKRM